MLRSVSFIVLVFISIAITCYDHKSHRLERKSFRIGIENNSNSFATRSASAKTVRATSVTNTPQLQIPYRSDEELDKTVQDLLHHIAFEADLRNCFSESNATWEGSDHRN